MGKLSVLKVSSAKKPGRYYDGGNLALVVGRSGKRWWTFLYMLNGRSREMGMGSADLLSLAEAREEAWEKRDGGLVSVAGFDGGFNFNLGGLAAEVSVGLAPRPVRVSTGELAAPRHPLEERKMDLLIDGQSFPNFSVPQDVAKAMMKFSRERTAGKSARTH